MKHGDSARRALEQLASIVGRCVVAGGEEVAARGGGAPPKDSRRAAAARDSARRAGDGARLGARQHHARSPSRGSGGGAIGADVHSNGLGPTDAGASAGRRSSRARRASCR